MNRRAWQVASLLFCSGFCALVYQTVWLREFRLVFGASTYATAAVLAIFMGGLGAGSAILGKRADTNERPLALYGTLELLISIAAALSPLLIPVAAKIYFASGGSPALGIFGATLLRLALSVIILGPATVLMGGTLPAAARAVETSADAGRRAVSLLYGINTLGAVAGTMLSTFLLIESFGNRMTLFLAVLVNVIVAIVARSMGRDQVVSASAVESDDAAEPEVARGYVYAASAIVGFAFLLMELVWYRMLSPILGGTTYMFGLVLAVALLGIGGGGTAYALFRRGPATVGGFAIICSLEALAVAIPFALGDRLAVLTQALRGLGTYGFSGQVLSWTFVTMIVVFPAAFISGVQFPMLISLLGRGRENVGREIGAAYAWNTGGAIAGSLAGGFGLLPILSAPTTWRLVAIVLAVLAIGAAILTRRRVRVASLAGVIVVAALAASAAMGPTAVWRHSGIGADRGPQLGSRNDLQSWINTTRGGVWWEKDGRESSIGVIRRNDIAFFVNGKSDGTARGDAATQVMLGMIPVTLHPNPTNALVIGLGSGSTSGWMARVPSMQRVDVVELEPVVLEFAEACAPVNAGAMTNPRMHTEIGDAREVLLTRGDRYDIIASAPSNPYRAGIASLLTREFYVAVRDRLKPGGYLAQWMQSYSISTSTMQTIYATLTSVFPNVQTWWTSSGDMVLLASMDPIVVDADLLRQRAAAEPYRSAMFNTWRISTAEAFVARMFANENFARAAAANAVALNTDDRTVIEYGLAQSLESEMTLHRQMREDAAAAGMHRPLHLRGSLNWEAVEHTRPWHHDLARPRNVGQLAEAGLAAARRDPSRGEAYARTVSRFQPVEADVILAAARITQQRPDEAVELLRRALVALRSDPWPQPSLAGAAVDMSIELARVSPQHARVLYDTLAQPFSAFQQENSRRFARIMIAPLFDGCGQQTLASLHLVEPYPFWRRDVLAIRARCYSEAGDDLASRAVRDYEEFVAGQPAPLFRPQDRPAQRGSS